MIYAHPLDHKRTSARSMSTRTVHLTLVSLLQVDTTDVLQRDLDSYARVRDSLSIELSIRNAPGLPACANCERAVEEHDEDTGECPREVVMGTWDNLQ